MRAAGGKLFGKRHTNPRARTRNQCPLALPFANHFEIVLRKSALYAGSAGFVLRDFKTDSFNRELCAFIRSINRRAQTNSAAKSVSPRKMTNQPGPGVNSITA